MGDYSGFLSKYLEKKRNSLVSRNVKSKTVFDVGCNRGYPNESKVLRIRCFI